MRRITAVLPLVLLLGSLLACGAPQKTVIRMPVKPLAENTLENRQIALTETALAFYYQNPFVQYENKVLTIGEPASARDNMSLTPEMCGADAPIYSVCSDYCHKVAKQTLGVEMMELPAYKFLTDSITKLPADDPLVVYKYGGEDGNQDIGTVKRDILDTVQPGDMLVYYRKSGSGHAVLYTGKLFDDDPSDFLECGGGHMDMNKLTDPREATGAILRNHLERYTLVEKWFERLDRCVLLRPAKLESGVLTPAAQVRLRYPHMELHKSFSRPIQQTLTPGETVTVTVSVTNHSHADYTEFYLSEPVPLGLTASAPVGFTEQDGNMVWLGTVPQGQTVKLSYDVVISGNIGDTVTFESGFVDGMLPTRKAVFRLAHPLLTAAQEEKIRESAETILALGNSAVSTTDFVNRVYETVFGVSPELPGSFAEVLKLLTEPVEYGDEINLAIAEPKTEDARRIAAMVIPKHIAGRRVLAYGLDANGVSADFDSADSVTAYWHENYLPGDVFFSSVGSPINPDEQRVAAQIIVDRLHTVEFSYDESGAAAAEVKTFVNSIQNDMPHSVTVGLRPAQAGLLPAE